MNTKFKKGHVPWNKGKEFDAATRKRMSLARIGKFGNEKHPAWKGDNVGYTALHDWVRARLVKPANCANCRKHKPLDLANKSHNYKRDLTDWLWLCKSSHFIYDGKGKILLLSRKDNPIYKKRLSESIKQSWIKRREYAKT